MTNLFALFVSAICVALPLESIRAADALIQEQVLQTALRENQTIKLDDHTNIQLNLVSLAILDALPC